MKTKLTLALLILMASIEGLAANCKLIYYNQNQFKDSVHSIPEIRDLSQTVNNILKKSFDTAEKIDDATYGLVSAVATGGTPIDRLRPEQWDKMSLSGHLIYQDSPFAGTSLKGAKMTFSEGDNSRTITTGAYGEFAESFSKIVPYKRLRLFPVPFFYVGKKSVPTMNIPITVKIESTICHAETRVDKVPFEPLVFILSQKE